jgi:hypothetical protein
MDEMRESMIVILQQDGYKEDKKKEPGQIHYPVYRSFLIQPAMAGDNAKLDHAVAGALKKLYAKYPGALELSKVAKGVMVFPSVTKAGLLVGGQYGEGTLLLGGGVKQSATSIPSQAPTDCRRAPRNSAMPCFSWIPLPLST